MKIIDLTKHLQKLSDISIVSKFSDISIVPRNALNLIYTVAGALELYPSIIIYKTTVPSLPIVRLKLFLTR